MSKYTLYRKNFEISNNSICLLPTIVVKDNDWMYTLKNFAIEFHFLCFHARLLWMKDNGLKDVIKREMRRGNEDAE